MAVSRRLFRAGSLVFGFLKLLWRRRHPVATAVVAISAAAMVPLGGWAGAWAVVPRLGWRWLPLMTAVAGMVILAERAAARWRLGGRRRRRPVAERVPLFIHVAALLTLASLIALAAGFGMWTVLGRPDLGTPAGSAPGATGWSVANTFDAAKIVLSIVAGIGGVVALTVAYRKQDHGEAAEHRENTKLFNERFGKAADQLGSDKAAVRLAGAYAMAGLADDWEDGRQTCIDVLCAYLRAPYDPPADLQQCPPSDDKEGVSIFKAELRATREQQQVRHTVIALIRDHLTQADTTDRPRWHGHKFDLSGATFDGGSFAGINLCDGTQLSFHGATFADGTFFFNRATLTKGLINFSEATFADGGRVTFSDTLFLGGMAIFRDARFSGGSVTFSRTTFSKDVVTFGDAKFSGGTVSFGDAEFSGATVNFSDAEFSGGAVLFARANFSAGIVHFGNSLFSGGSTVAFSEALFSGSKVSFARASFSGGSVSFARATFSGGIVSFAGPQSWSTPPSGIRRDEKYVEWPDFPLP